MRIFDGTMYRNASEDEISTMQSAQSTIESYERIRPLTESDVTRLLIAQQINTLEVDDTTALRMLEFYPEWVDGQDYAAGFKVQWRGKLWRCIQVHTSQDSWAPSTDTASLWERIDETHDGTKYDPIPYDGNMELFAGLYYTQGGVTYLCNRNTGQPVYNAMSELVGLYVEIAE